MARHVHSTQEAVSHLRLVPADGSGFKAPRRRKVKQPVILSPDAERILQAAETALAVVERLAQAIYAGDTIVVRALAGQARTEAGYVACVARQGVPAKVPA